MKRRGYTTSRCGLLMLTFFTPPLRSKQMQYPTLYEGLGVAFSMWQTVCRVHYWTKRT